MAWLSSRPRSGSAPGGSRSSGRGWPDRRVRPCRSTTPRRSAHRRAGGSPAGGSRSGRRSRLSDTLAGLLRLLLGDGDADDGDVVMGRGMDGHRAPAAADVQQLSARRSCKAELAADQLVLGGLGCGQIGVGAGEAGTRVRHRRPEDERVEVVADVVVVADRLGVAVLGVPAAVQVDLLRRRRQRPAEHAQAARRGDHLARPARRGRATSPELPAGRRRARRCRRRCRARRRRTPWPARARSGSTSAGARRPVRAGASSATCARRARWRCRPTARCARDAAEHRRAGEVIGPTGREVGRGLLSVRGPTGPPFRRLLSSAASMSASSSGLGASRTTMVGQRDPVQPAARGPTLGRITPCRIA